MTFDATQADAIHQLMEAITVHSPREGCSLNVAPIYGREYGPGLAFSNPAVLLLSRACAYANAHVMGAKPVKDDSAWSEPGRKGEHDERRIVVTSTRSHGVPRSSLPGGRWCVDLHHKWATTTIMDLATSDPLIQTMVNEVERVCGMRIPESCSVLTLLIVFRNHTRYSQYGLPRGGIGQVIVTDETCWPTGGHDNHHPDYRSGRLQSFVRFIWEFMDLDVDSLEDRPGRTFDGSDSVHKRYQIFRMFDRQSLTDLIRDREQVLRADVAATTFELQLPVIAADIVATNSTTQLATRHIIDHCLHHVAQHSDLNESFKRTCKLAGVRHSGPGKSMQAKKRYETLMYASARQKVVRAYIEQASVAGLTRLRCTYSLIFRWIPSDLPLAPGVPRADALGTPSVGIWEQ